MFKNILKTLSCLLILSMAFGGIPSKDYPIGFYELTDIKPNSEQTQWIGTLAYKGDEVQYGPNNAIIKNLKFTLTYQGSDQLQVKIEDADNSLRWQIPESDIFPYTSAEKRSKKADSAVEVEFKESPFGFKIIRKGVNKEVIFDTTIDTLIFSEYYLEISTTIPSSNIYGLGERTSKLNLGAGTYSIWNADPTQKTEAGAGQNSYGSHPVYLVKETQKEDWSIVLLRNSNAMSVELTDAKKITYRTTGGIIDLNFFISNPTSNQPEGVIQSYHTYLGGWALPPFWSFGYHQSKTGYSNLQALTDIVKTYNKYELPFDAIWSDVDYMDNYKTFTVSEDKFQPEKFNQLLQENKKRWVPLIESGITKDSDFYKGINSKNYFIQRSDNTEFVGKVGSSDCVWMDWFYAYTPEQWKQGLNSLRNKVQFTGLWLNRNEVSNAITENIGDNKDIINNLPYNPTGSPLHTNTIILDAKHSNGKTEFNTHNLFPLMESYYTYQYLENHVAIPFILSRATIPGSGKYAAHWNGDIPSTWESLKNSITNIMNFNLYGIPMTGSDICGTKKDTTEELCTRWIQVGALYPFARSHADKEAGSHEPWALGEKVFKASRVALQLRYSLLKHYYGLFLEKLQATGSGKRLGSGTIFRPLFFEFTEDALFDSKKNYADTEFLIGSSLLVAPVVEEGATTRDVYFPVATWYNLFTGKKVISQSEANRVLNVNASLNSTIPLFLRAGSIVPFQNTRGVLRTDDLDAIFELIVGLSDDNLASGNIFGVDDEGEINVKKKCVTQNCLVKTSVEVIRGNNHLNVSITFAQPDSYELVEISGLRIYGIAIGNNLFSSDFLTIHNGGKDFTFVQAADGALKIRFLNPRVLDFGQEKEVTWLYRIPITNPKLITQ